MKNDNAVERINYDIQYKDYSFAQAFLEIDALGKPERDPSSRLSYNYFKKLFEIIMKNARKSFAAEKNDYRKKRRVFLNE